MVITITTNAGQVAGDLRKKFKIMKNENQKTLGLVATRGVNIAKSMAPIKTGALKAGITKLVNKDKATIMSVVPSAFPYHFWVNQQPSHKSLNFSKGVYRNGKQIIAPGTVAVYDESPSGWKWTGTPRYFTITARLLEDIFFKDIDRSVSKSLRS